MMIETEEEAKAFVAERCSDAAFAKLEQFVAELRIEAEHQNLISRSTIDSVWQRHVADSAQLLDHVPRETPGTTRGRARRGALTTAGARCRPPAGTGCPSR